MPTIPSPSPPTTAGTTPTISHFARLILGTAQLGMSYGIANLTGQPSLRAATDIVAAALESGIELFDTAQAYGESETVLGLALKTLGASQRARIVSKLPPELSKADATGIRSLVRASLERLGVTGLTGLLLHREEHLVLLDGPIGGALHEALEEGLTGGLGVSVYSPEAATAALRHPLVHTVQLPASLFDRRFATAGIFALARELGKEIQIRSALLQGVLCLEPEALPTGLAPLSPALAAFHGVCRRHACNPAPLALAWVLREYPEAYVLFGAETPQQVHMNFDCIRHVDDFSPNLWEELSAVLPPQEAALLNPSIWKL